MKKQTLMEWACIAIFGLNLGLLIAAIVAGEYGKAAAYTTATVYCACAYFVVEDWTQRLRAKWFPRKLPTHQTSMAILFVSPEEKELHLQLGIHTERFEALAELVNGDGEKKFHEVVEAIGEHAVHPNEVFYLSFVLGHGKGVQDNPFAKMISDMLQQPPQ